MQFPESWLREYCDPSLSTQELADLLTMSGMEVEELRPVAPAFSRVVVARVVGVERHPNADRLNVCQVDAGTGEHLQIVCGAPNVAAGLTVPCALVGAELPPSEPGAEPFRIKLGKLRGVESQGMLCSARELGLSEDHGGLLVLPGDASVGTDLRQQLQLDDQIFTLKLTPNLGHCLSVYGIAREVSALTGTPLKTPVFEPVAPGHDRRLPVSIVAKDLCGRFSGRVVEGVDPRASTPAWMVDRLARCGQRSVNALVDISNYVMFEYGRPSHIFDLDKIDKGLAVRWGKPGEQLKLLNGNTIELDEQVGVIADAACVESLAGIMGGDATAVSDDTRNVYVEAAFWWPEAVAGRSRRYNFSTDAGHRFERGVDPQGTVEHIEHITRLIQSICGGVAGPIDDQQPNMPRRQPVSLRVDRAARVIGMPIDAARCAGVFSRLGLPFEESPGRLTVTPPSWRFDLQIEEDLIEEVIRVVGYKNLPDVPPRGDIQALAQPETRRGVHALRQAMAAQDYQETVNFSFVEARWETELAGNDHPVRVLNPIASPLSVMRSSLMGSLVQVLRHNLARRAPRVRVFELGRVFIRDAASLDGSHQVAGLRQPLRLGGLAYGPAEPTQWGAKERQVDFFDVKGDLEQLLGSAAAQFTTGSHPALHPGRCASIVLEGRVIGHVGELHPRWRQSYELPGAPILFELDAQALQARSLPAYVPLPRQQSAWRDVAVVIGDGISHERLIAAVTTSAGGLVRSARLFDVYRPSQPVADMQAGERSVALRLELRDDEATLTDERIDAEIDAVLRRLADEVGARRRG